jgi:NADPH-dependent F420 reductase
VSIAIIGAGNVGTALATSMTRAGYDVAISAADAAHAQRAAQASGARAAQDNRSAVRDADVVVLAIPYVAAGESVASEIAPLVEGKVVVDATNPIAPDCQSLVTNGTSAAETFQQRLPKAKVVKAFNSMFASRMAAPDADVDAFVAADDEEAKRQVLSLVDSLGFRSLDVGPLSFARHLEGMAFVNIALNAANGWSWVSAWKLER